MNGRRIAPSQLLFRPVTTLEWPDMQALFAEHGDQRGCWCMYWRVKCADFSAGFGEPLRQAMARIIADGSVPGLLAYDDGRPVGWVSIAPRADFPVLGRSRTLKPVDDHPVWSITCFFVAADWRNRGISRALIEAAIRYAQSQGARIVEAYPILAQPVRSPVSESCMGRLSTFERAGFHEVARRSPRRAIVRYTISGRQDTRL